MVTRRHFLAITVALAMISATATANTVVGRNLPADTPETTEQDYTPVYIVAERAAVFSMDDKRAGYLIGGNEVTLQKGASLDYEYALIDFEGTPYKIRASKLLNVAQDRSDKFTNGLTTSVAVTFAGSYPNSELHADGIASDFPYLVMGDEVTIHETNGAFVKVTYTGKTKHTFWTKQANLAAYDTK